MRQSSDGVRITILGKEYTVGCPADKRDELLSAAGYLDKCMRDIQQSGSVLGTERVAVMAALNIAHDFISLRDQQGLDKEVEERIRKLRAALEETLDGQREMEL